MKTSTRESTPTRVRTKPIRRARSLAQLVSRLRVDLPELAEKYGVKSLGVFGSYLRGEQKPRSDLDILVELDAQHPSFSNLVHLQDELSKTIGVKVDLVENKNLKPFIGERILSEVIWLRRDGEDLRVRLPRPKREAFRMAPKREYMDYLNDVLQAMDRAEQYTAGKTFDEFIQNNMAVDALSKVVENMGEATKHIPNEVRNRHPELDWKGMAGTRDHIAHGYFAINLPSPWETATVLIPTVKPRVAAVLEKELQRRRPEEEAKQGTSKKKNGEKK